MVKTTKWLECYRPRSNPKIRLFCYPYAGAGAQIYRLWQKLFDEGIEVCPIQPPGRWSRIQEAMPNSLNEVVVDCFDGLVEYFDIPFAFYGHSIGSLVLFELTRLLRKKDLPEPIHLFVAARGGPELPHSIPSIYSMPDEELIKFMDKLFGAIPEAVLKEKDFLKMLLPCLRADLEAYQSYQFCKEKPLDCPISALGGKHDSVWKKEHLETWENQTINKFEIQIFDGDHIFIKNAKSVVSYIESQLAEYL